MVKILLCAPKIIGVEQRAALEGNCTQNSFWQDGRFLQAALFPNLSIQGWLTALQKSKTTKN